MRSTLAKLCGAIGGRVSVHLASRRVRAALLVAALVSSGCGRDGPAGGVCGDGAKDPAEVCDGTDLGGASCESLGHGAGTLSCTTACTFDETGCSVAPGCGDGVVDPGEQCDGVNLAGQTCLSLGYEGGSLGCDAACRFDATGCEGSFCGNGILDSDEACDGPALGGETCASQGYVGGTLGCDGSCQLDVSGCTDCGNGAVDPGEACDGADLRGESCLGLGHDGGTLGCDASCQLDASGCTDCGDGLREGSEVCDGADLGGATCEALGYQGGSLACDGSCQLDASGCTDCGNGAIDPGEACDGADLWGESCLGLGHDGGTLGCDASCQLDASGCTDCGDGLREGSELCDGADLGGATCQARGFDGGTLSCVATCAAFDEAGCCLHGCPTAGATRCAGTRLETCVLAGGCRAWNDTTDCAPSLCGGSPAACLTPGTGGACDDVYVLNGHAFPHTVPGLFASGVLPDPGSCQTGAHGLYLAYTLESTGTDRLLVTLTDHNAPAAWPQVATFTTTQAGEFCDPAQRTELGCAVGSGSTLRAVANTSGLSPGATVYLLVSGNDIAHPLLDPEVTVEEIDCAQTAQASLTLPAPPTDVHPRSNIEIDFTGDLPMRNAGLVRIYEDSVLVDTYNLITAPPEVTWIGGTMIVNPSFDFSLGATVRLRFDLVAGVCQTAVAGSFDFQITTTPPLTGESCVGPLPLAPGVNAVLGTYEAFTLDVLSAGLVSCYPGFAGAADAVWAFTQPPSNTAVQVTIDKSSSNRLVMVLLDDCAGAVSPLACATDYSTSSLSLVAGGLTPGATYYLVVGEAYTSAAFPDPGFTEIELTPFQPVCGNGTIDLGETCDDGDAVSGDGCSTACTVEPGWQCSGIPSTCVRICGNGILNPGELCDGVNLNGQTCTSIGQGYIGGTLACAATCDAWNTNSCIAGTTILSQEFSSWVPSGWVVQDGGSDTDTWSWCNGCPPISQMGVSLTGANGAFVYIDDDSHGDTVLMTEGLVSPSFSTVGYTNVRLQFRHYLEVYANETAEVQVSVNGGPFVTAVVYAASTTNGAAVDLDLSALAANQPNVRVRFLYNDGGSWGWFWLIDSVRVLGY